MVLVKEIMSRDVLKISESASVVELTSILTRHRITGLPVLNNKGALVGVVSEFDVIERKGRHVGDIMSRDPITITADTPIADAARLFVDRHIRRAPVMDGTKMVGIVSRSDIIRFFATKQWQCGECGYSDRGFSAPETCPKCTAGSARFTLTAAPAGA